MQNKSKYFLHFFVIVFFAMGLYSCNTLKPTKQKVDISSHAFSATYKAPVFIDDKRVETIKSIWPEIEKVMMEHAKTNNIPGVAYGIVVDNELVMASAAGLINIENEIQATPKSFFRIASMTKSFTAMAIMKLRDEGKLDLSDPVSKYIPEMAKLEYLTADAPTIDIENLLTMTSGFPEDNPWGDRQLDESDEMLIELIANGISFSNSTSYQFEYSNTGYALLGNIVSRISGIPFQKYIEINILKPLGMEQTYWEYENVPKDQLAIGYLWEDDKWKLEPMLHDGSYGAMGGLITNIEDFSKYVSFQLSAWPPRSDVDFGPVKRSTLREMQTPKFSELYPNDTGFNGDTCAIISGYGYGLGIAEYCDNMKVVGHSGSLPGFASNYRFFPEYGIGIMAFSNLHTTPWPYNKIGKILFENTEIKPRQLPISDILIKRQEQLTKLIKNWDAEIADKILAENFYLDKTREDRIKEVQEVLDKAGAIKTIDEMKPINQLRGSFKLQTENGFINVFFTLTPEKYPKVQRLDISFKPNEVE